MSEDEGLAKRFQENTKRLRSLAYRMLGSRDDAEDVVQEAWIRLQGTGAGDIANLIGWLTTVVSRICLDLLRSRAAHRQAAAGAPPPESAEDPEAGLALTDALGPALLLVLETLSPAERIAFVLHDMFNLSFEEIGSIVGRSPVAARQLASRARNRIHRRGEAPEVRRKRHQELVSAFLEASRQGNLPGLLALLAPDAVMQADSVAVETANLNRWAGAPSLPGEVRGATGVAELFKGRARGATQALIEGEPGAVWVQGGESRAVFAFTCEGAQIVSIELIMDPERLTQLRPLIVPLP